MIASKANMNKHYLPGVFAYSPYTGEECSANPGDYWNQPDIWIMKDSEGQHMVLARKEVKITEVEG